MSLEQIHSNKDYLIGNFVFQYPIGRCLDPDISTVKIAQELVLNTKNKQGLRVLDLGSGSGIFSTALLLHAHQSQFSLVRSVDIDSSALEISKFNITRVCDANKINPCLEFSLSDWFAETRGRFNLIYANPPYLTNNLATMKMFDNSPSHAVYAANFDEHYNRIISMLLEHIMQGSIVIFRTPRSDEKVNRIKQLIYQYININQTIVEDKAIGIGRYIKLFFI